MGVLAMNPATSGQRCVRNPVERHRMSLIVERPLFRFDTVTLAASKTPILVAAVDSCGAMNRASVESGAAAIGAECINTITDSDI